MNIAAESKPPVLGCRLPNMKRTALLTALVVSPALLFTSKAGAASSAATPVVTATTAGVDRAAFMAAQDMTWRKAPKDLYDSPLIGNGLLGAYLHQREADELVFELGRSDIENRSKDLSQYAERGSYRFAPGRLILKTAGKIKDWDLRLSLRDGLLSGTVTTANGLLKLRAFIPAREGMALIVELRPEGTETGVDWKWEPYPVINPRFVNIHKRNPEKPLPAALPTAEEKQGDIPVFRQMHDLGETATAWHVATSGKTVRLVASIAHTHPEKNAADLAVASVKEAEARKTDDLLVKSVAWWRAYADRTFVSLPDAWWTAFYHAQMYKLAAATRPDGVPLDIQGPWAQYDTGWAGMWWNLNIQLTYSPVHTGNRLDIADSFRLPVREKRAVFFKNAAKTGPDCAGMGRASGMELACALSVPGKNKTVELGNLPWACQILWKQYRYTMDESTLRDDLFPLLRGAVNSYLRYLEKDKDGVYHLPETHSPEYGDTRDCNYDLALLRWGCATLLKADKLLGAKDPLAPKWRDVLDHLTPYPVNDDGYKIGADLVLEHSHRHDSHLFMINPLQLVNLDDPAENALARKSILHWHGLEKGKGLCGFSFPLVSSMYAQFDDGEAAFKALESLRALSRPGYAQLGANTMFKEGTSPVIETPIAGAESIHDLILKSDEKRIGVFTATPPVWKDVSFGDLLADGAFAVSATRRNGATAWVKITSRAGSPLRLRTKFAGEPRVTGIPASAVKKLPDGDYAITLPKGATVELTAPGATLGVVAVPVTAGKPNPFGLH